jgi:hypothetical protein
MRSFIFFLVPIWRGGHQWEGNNSFTAQVPSFWEDNREAAGAVLGHE